MSTLEVIKQANVITSVYSFLYMFGDITNSVLITYKKKKDPNLLSDRTSYSGCFSKMKEECISKCVEIIYRHF